MQSAFSTPTTSHTRTSYKDEWCTLRRKNLHPRIPRHKKPAWQLGHQGHILSYLITNRLWQLGKENLGLSAACGGTGFCVSTSIYRRFGWPAQSLTEDLEMQILYSLHGIKFSWSSRSNNLRRKTPFNQDAINQRVRWTIGHLDVQRRYVMKFIKNMIKQRDIKLLDQVVYCYRHYTGWFLSFCLRICCRVPCRYTNVQAGSNGSLCLNLLSLLIYPIAGFIWRPNHWGHAYGSVSVAFTPIWFVALILAIKNFNKKDWFHTPHGVTKGQNKVLPVGIMAD